MSGERGGHEPSPWWQEAVAAAGMLLLVAVMLALPLLYGPTP